MNFIWQSLRTFSYWRYAVLSIDGFKTFLSIIGAAWGIIEVFDYFNLWNRNDFPVFSVYLLLVFAFIVVLVTRRPLRRIEYKLQGRDLCVEVRIGDIFKIRGQKAIGTNTTFDTELSNGIISTASIQGQFTNTYYPQNIPALDAEIERGLIGEQFQQIQKMAGKTQSYPLGTTVKIKQGSETFYLFAMASLNEFNVAETTPDEVIISLSQLWKFISTKGEKEDIVIPLVGTGLGRITTNRKQLLARIAQSFIKASEARIFCNKLTIVIYHGDVKRFGINLFEVRDLLNNYLP